MKKKKQIPPPTKAELQGHRDKGWSREEIADHYGVGLTTVKRWIKLLGIGPRTTRNSPKKPKAKKEPKLEEGYTIMDILAFRLGDRLGENKNGYTLDGKPCNLDDLMVVARLEFPKPKK